MQAVCQMIMFGDLEFEKLLLHLNNDDHEDHDDHNPAGDDRAVAALNMFSLNCTGEHNQSHAH